MMNRNILKSFVLILLMGKIDTAAAGELAISIFCDGQRTDMNNPEYHSVSLREIYPAGAQNTLISNQSTRGVFLNLSTPEPQKYDIQTLNFLLENNKSVSFMISKYQSANDKAITVQFLKEVDGKPTGEPIRLTYDEMQVKDPDFKPWVQLIAGDTDVRLLTKQEKPS